MIHLISLSMIKIAHELRFLTMQGFGAAVIYPLLITLPENRTQNGAPKNKSKAHSTCAILKNKIL